MSNAARVEGSSEPADDERRDPVAELGERLEPSTVRALSRLDPRVSTLHIVCEWAALVAAATLCWRYFHPLTYVVTVAFIGARQHSLGLLLHDAAHYRLFNNRRLNDWVAELFLAWPFVVLSMRNYRVGHFRHHRFLNSEDDPDWTAKRNAEWRFPMPLRKLVLMLLLDVVGVGFIKLVRKARALPKAKLEGPDQRAMDIVRPLYLVAILALLAYAGLLTQLALFWLVPFVTWFQLCMHLRGIAEHFGIQNRLGFFAGTRSTERGIFDRIFVLSNDASFHAEHHLYPSVPFYRLRALNRELVRGRDYAQSARLSRGYLAVVRECTQR